VKNYLNLYAYHSTSASRAKLPVTSVSRSKLPTA